MTAWDFLKELNKVCCFMSRERGGKATNSELKRWLQNKSVSINGIRMEFDQEVGFPITEMFLFPKRKVTLF
jgi:hypothetical protein